MAISQAQKLSYTRRDVESYHDDVSRYLKVFIPRITDTSEANEGRLYLTAIEALIDNANYSLDKAALEARPSKAKERQSVIDAAYLADYKLKNVSASSVDAIVSMITGVAGVGGQAIPAFSVFKTSSSPTYQFLSLDAVTIPEGESSISIPLVQGVRTEDYVLTASASGEPYQSYRLPASDTPDVYVEVKVNGISWTNPDRNDLYLSGPQDEEFYTTLDADNYLTVRFGDGVPDNDETFGKIPPAGASVTVTYIQCDRDYANLAPGTIDTVVGSLASTVKITQSLASSGGADSESVSSIARNLAANHSSYDRAVRLEDYEYFARATAGVYDAYAKHSDGTLSDLYIMPDGGGVASSTLLSQVNTTLASKKLEGAVVYTHALSGASILITANMVLKSTKSQKSTARLKARQAIDAALVYTEIKPGQGFKLSDVTSLFENLSDGTLVEYVDIVVLSRVPAVIKSNSSAPDFSGRVAIFSNSTYATYLVQALTTSTFLVSKDGVPQGTSGSVGVEFTSDAGDVKFTLGTTLSVLTVGDTWTFKTSKYSDNIYLDPFEFMQKERDSDVLINVYYPREYSFTTKSSV